MKKLLVYSLLLLLFAGCGVKRVGPFAPRRPDTPDHREATQSADCIECHDVSGIREHAPDNPCLNCHSLIPGR